MYYVNHEQIDLRLQFIPTLIAACQQLEKVWVSAPPSEKLLLHMAQERVLHLTIETITDVGSLLIDAFMMRDASSYEDIIEILTDERVFEAHISSIFKELVQLRKSLAQEYASYTREELHPLICALPDALAAFEIAVPAFISRELV